MSAELQDRAAQLVDEALTALEDSGRRLESVIRAATRIARLRGDWENLWWLEMELWAEGTLETQKSRLLKEVAGQLPGHLLKRLHEETVDAWMEERCVTALIDSDSHKAGDKITLPWSVPELEAKADDAKQFLETIRVASGRYPQNHPTQGKADQYALRIQQTVVQAKSVLGRIRTRLHAFLSVTERQLHVSGVSADIFERNQRYVDRRLVDVAPEAAEQFKAARGLLRATASAETRSQALTSCRRALKTLADALYPATNTAVECADGKERILTDDKYLSRLRQYMHERWPSSAARQLSLAQLDDVGARLEKVNTLASKGVHASISLVEAEQCLIQTYLLIGEIVRLDDPSFVAS